MALTARDRAKIRFRHTEGFTACWVWDGRVGLGWASFAYGLQVGTGKHPAAHDKNHR